MAELATSSIFADLPEGMRIVDALRKWANNQPEVIKVIIYGSRARGDQREDSDLDVAVELTNTSTGDVPFAIWLDEADSWHRELQPFIPWRLHLEWHDVEGATPLVSEKIHRGCYIAYEECA